MILSLIQVEQTRLTRLIINTKLSIGHWVAHQWKNVSFVQAQVRDSWTGSALKQFLSQKSETALLEYVQNTVQPNVGVYCSCFSFNWPFDDYDYIYFGHMNMKNDGSPSHISQCNFPKTKKARLLFLLFGMRVRIRLLQKTLQSFIVFTKMDMFFATCIIYI